MTSTSVQPLHVERHGPRGPTAIVLHGGPGAPGSVGPLASALSDPTERFAETHRASNALYTYCRGPDADESVARADPKGHIETWNDMLRLQSAGIYPSAFASVRCPVLMLHGSYDPHPGQMIRDSLVETLPQLEYHEFERCGHDPWVEAHARAPFLATARGWLEEHLR